MDRRSDASRRDGGRARTMLDAKEKRNARAFTKRLLENSARNGVAFYKIEETVVESSEWGNKWVQLVIAIEKNGKGNEEKREQKAVIVHC